MIIKNLHTHYAFTRCMDYTVVGYFEKLYLANIDRSRQEV